MLMLSLKITQQPSSSALGCVFVVGKQQIAALPPPTGMECEPQCSSRLHLPFSKKDDILALILVVQCLLLFLLS